jgi:hypothetical protein
MSCAAKSAADDTLISEASATISGLAQSRKKRTFAPVLTMTRGERCRNAHRRGCANFNGEQRHDDLINIKLARGTSQSQGWGD